MLFERKAEVNAAMENYNCTTFGNKSVGLHNPKENDSSYQNVIE